MHCIICFFISKKFWFCFNLILGCFLVFIIFLIQMAMLYIYIYNSPPLLKKKAATTEYHCTIVMYIILILYSFAIMRGFCA